MKTFEAVARAIQNDDMENGHLGADQQWGKYERNARAALEALKRQGVISEAAVESIFKGEL